MGQLRVDKVFHFPIFACACFITQFYELQGGKIFYNFIITGMKTEIERLNYRWKQAGWFFTQTQQSLMMLVV